MRWAVGVGTAWGVFCGVVSGQPVVTTLAQMAIPWIWVAAVVAYGWATNTKQAAVLGGVALLAANLAYFVVGIVARGLADLPLISGFRLFVIWTVIGLAVGPVAGVVGWWLKSERTAPAAVVILATGSIAEPLALWAHIAHLQAHLAYVGVAAVGLALPLARFRRSRGQALKAAVLVMALTYPTAVMLEAILIWLGQISPPMRLV